ncbi:hypothetical protein V6N13_137323 [Hibiscus sabdariffa]
MNMSRLILVRPVSSPAYASMSSGSPLIIGRFRRVVVDYKGTSSTPPVPLASIIRFEASSSPSIVKKHKEVKIERNGIQRF